MCNGPHRDHSHVLGAERGSGIRARWRKMEQRPVSKPGGQGRKRKREFFPHFGGKQSCFVDVSCSQDLPGQGDLTTPHPDLHPTFGNHFDISELSVSLATEINKLWPPRLCRMLMKRLIIWCFFCFGFFFF